MNDVRRDQARLLGDQPRDDLGDLFWLCDVDEIGAVRHLSPHGAGDPSRVRHGRIDDVRGDAVVGELKCRRHRVVLQGRLGGAV